MTVVEQGDVVRPGFHRTTLHHAAPLARTGRRDTTRSQLVVSCTSALVVVIANVLMVTYLVMQARANPLPMENLANTPAAPLQQTDGAESLVVAISSASAGKVPAGPGPRVIPASRGSAPAGTGPGRRVSNGVASPAPTAAAAVAPGSSSTIGGVDSRVVPTGVPGTPLFDIAPMPDFLLDCTPTGYDDSASCVWSVVRAINNARSAVGIPALALPTNWSALSPQEQLYVATNLERTARGLSPLSAMSSALDAAAAIGADAGTDPAPPPGFAWTRWGGNWAGNVANPLEAVYFWMYDDGPGSGNVQCSATDASGCWGHWQNVLLPLACSPCIMGVAWTTTAQGNTSTTELIVDAQGSPAADFTWAEEEPYLFQP